MTPRCPSELELERGFWADDAEIAEHATGCDACRPTWDEIAGLRDLAGDIDGPRIDAARREDVRTAILASTGEASERPRRRWRLAAVATIAVAAAALLIAGQVGDDGALSIEGPERRGAIAASDGARWSLAGLQPDERINLASGTIEVDVDHLDRDERFRVVTDDGEVEVRGTRFSVTAIDGVLTRVAVSEGVVVVRAGGVERALTAGESWERVVAIAEPEPELEPAPAEPDPEPAPNPAPARAVTTIPAPAPAPPAPREPSIYEAAWDQLRARRFAQAAVLFERASAEGDRSFRRDAAYWAGISHFRGGDKRRARTVLARFLARYPGARRRAEVSVMLGWIEVENRRWDAAERRFQAGMGDPSVEIRRSAADGLRAVRRARGR